MISSIIIDDNQAFRDKLQGMISKYCPDIRVLGTAESVSTGIEIINKLKPDLIFLDVEMSDGNGFDLLSKLEQKGLEVIFTTGHSEYAIKAIKFSALDYLLKPIGVEELKTAIENLKHKINENHGQNLNLQLFLENFKNINNKADIKIALPTFKGYHFENINQIIRFEAESSYVLCYLKNRSKMMVCKTIGDYETLLSDHHFFRVHRKHLINLEEIVDYVRNVGGYVVMSDGSNIEVSKRKKDAFLYLFLK